MASAILLTGNGPRSSDYTSKYTSSNTSNLNFTRFQSIQNPNPSLSHFLVGNTREVRGSFQTHQHLPYSVPPQPTFIRYPINSVSASSGYRYITFRLSSYTRTELRELKNRLISDLERVRFLRQRLCSTPTPKMTYHPPLLQLPAPNMTCHPPRLELPAPPDVVFTGKTLQKTAISRKRTNPLPPVRDTKKQCARMTQAQKRKMMMRECGQILGKLMQHKHGWVFNTPVDAVGLKLFDYHKIINKPMDLGTIKSKLAKNEYNSPLSFASDVRLTFQNAMVYNGKGSNVFIMAERLLLLFENLFNSRHQTPVNRVKKQNQITKSMARVSKKQWEMTEAEKAELGARLMSLNLGPEGLKQVVEIVKKRVLGLEQHQGDELELDIAVLDNDTLWELQGFITKHSNEVVANCGGNEVVVEEDVDIGDEMESTVFTPIVIDKDGSSSESSSESESSSSGGGIE